VPMFQNEIQPENHLERSTPLNLQSRPQDGPDAEVQRKRMLIALGILLVALAAVVLKDWDFWFPPTGEVEEAAVRTKHKTMPPAQASTPAAPAREHRTVKSPDPTPARAASNDAPMSATTERAALPPLEVEVVAGNQHISIPAKSNAIHLDVDSGTTPPPATAPAANATVNAGNRVQLSPLTTQNVTVSVPPDYPLLARQMKVQGAVSLQALISREGSIQELQILSGPAILAVAAREAVKQWHFKPYLQNGQPVETEARITVNFTISTN
jgi:TonB family protein